MQNIKSRVVPITLFHHIHIYYLHHPTLPPTLFSRFSAIPTPLIVYIKNRRTVPISLLYHIYHYNHYPPLPTTGIPPYSLCTKASLFHIPPYFIERIANETRTLHQNKTEQNRTKRNKPERNGTKRNK